MRALLVLPLVLALALATAEAYGQSTEFLVPLGVVGQSGAQNASSVGINIDALSQPTMEITVFGETVTVGVLAGDLPEQSISIADHGDGTATVTIGQGTEAGAYMFWIEATDPFNHVLEPFVVQIP